MGFILIEDTGVIVGIIDIGITEVVLVDELDIFFVRLSKGKKICF